MIEQKRGCGWRKVGGYYLVGGSLSAPCDRLPFPLTQCPTCGGGIKLGRNYTGIDPLHLFGMHTDPLCKDLIQPCAVCQPSAKYGIIIKIGDGFYKTPADFLKEAAALGISRKVAGPPRDKRFVLGETWVYLAHKKACTVEKTPTLQYSNLPEGAVQPRLLEAPVKTLQMGIFAAFRPTRLEKIVNESDLKDKEKMAVLAKRGISPVGVPDDDLDHH